MGLQSFKELLLKKSVGNKALEAFVLNIGEDILESRIVEALEKMAITRPTENTGRGVNGIVANWAANLDEEDIDELRDALSHHMSHYRAALKAHHEAQDPQQADSMRKVANQHLNHLIPLMHLAAKASKHSHGKLDMKYENALAAWETNYTTLRRSQKNPKRLHLDPKLLGARPSERATGWKNGGTGLTDYHYLEMPPHPGHEANATMTHEGGYPWEEVQLGTPEQVDNGEGYVHIEDLPAPKDYTPHPFDEHPIYRKETSLSTPVHEIQEAHLGQERRDKEAENLDNWRFGEHHQRWLKMHEDLYNKDPAAYEARGKQKSPHLYDGIPLQDSPDHVNEVDESTGMPKWPKVEKKDYDALRAKGQNKGDVAAAKLAAAPAPSRPMAGGPIVRRKASETPASPAAPAAPATPPGQSPWEPHYQEYMKLGPNDDKSLYHGNSEFMDYLKTKKGGQ